MPGLTHYVSLDGPAGVEMQFAEFVTTAAQRHPEWTHALVHPSLSIHPIVRQHLAGALRHELRAKHWGRLKVPAFPRALRVIQCRRRLAQAATDVVLIWNRSARVGFVLDAAGAQRCIHFEHGAAWFAGRTRERADYFSRIPLAITNSRAAARVLELMWHFEGPIEICRNALRPSLVPAQAEHKAYPRGRPIRIGVVARLFPVKAVALAIRTLRLLRDASIDAELHIAGDGPERARLESLAAMLGVDAAVRFHGVVASMAPFYRMIDCLVHVPISEAFGLVAIEAAAYGCPVIAACVDGLPEAVGEGPAARCLRPELTLDDYVALGGNDEQLPALVYDPTADALCAPKIVAPSSIADAVVDVFATAPRFEASSRAASLAAARADAFDDHVDAAIAIIDRFARSREPVA